MALALFILVSTHCLLHSSALITNKPADDLPRNRSMRLEARTKNAAGCFPIGSHEKNSDGICPVEDLKRILEEGVTLLSGGAPSCREMNKNITWCKKPRADPLLNVTDRKWYAGLLDFMKTELAQTDKSLPIVAVVWDQAMKANAQSAQVMNFMCGFERLNMSKRVVLFATSENAYNNFVVQFPNAINVFHPDIMKFAAAMAERTNVVRINRVMKLVVAQILLDAGRDVLITDTDIAWIRDSSEVFHKSGLDFAAMPDACGHDINSGFVYYRNVPKTKDLLHMALSTWRESWLCGDNDQYVLNCGFKRAAIKGLNYRVLPKNSWTVRCTGNIKCNCRNFAQELGDHYGQQMFGIGDGYPYAYHTFGMTADYHNELDMLAALGMVDVDFKTGQCKKGLKKMISTDTLTKQCSTSEGGITHAMCDGSCKPEPARAEAFVADLRRLVSG